MEPSTSTVFFGCILPMSIGGLLWLLAIVWFANSSNHNPKPNALNCKLLKKWRRGIIRHMKVVRDDGIWVAIEVNYHNEVTKEPIYMRFKYTKSPLPTIISKDNVCLLVMHRHLEKLIRLHRNNTRKKSTLEVAKGIYNDFVKYYMENNLEHKGNGLFLNQRDGCFYKAIKYEGNPGLKCYNCDFNGNKFGICNTEISCIKGHRGQKEDVVFKKVSKEDAKNYVSTMSL